MRCEDLFAALVEYVDGDLDAEMTSTIRDHLERCPSCDLVVDNIRKTIFVYSSDPKTEMPPTFEQHLGALLEDRWRAKFASGDPGDTAGGCI